MYNPRTALYPLMLLCLGVACGGSDEKPNLPQDLEEIVQTGHDLPGPPSEPDQHEARGGEDAAAANDASPPQPNPPLPFAPVEPANLARCHAKACGLNLGPASCSGAGCRWESECDGFARGCHSIASDYVCSQQQGCYWQADWDPRAYGAGHCSGVARNCSSLGSFMCGLQAGCQSTGRCVEGLNFCDYRRNQADCQASMGCAWY